MEGAEHAEGRGRPRKAAEGRGSRQKDGEACRMQSWGCVAGPGRRWKRQTPAEDYGGPQNLLRAVEHTNIAGMRKAAEIPKTRNQVEQRGRWLKAVGGGGMLGKTQGTRMAANGVEGDWDWRKAAEGCGRQSKTLKVLKAAEGRGRPRKAAEGGKDGEVMGEVEDDDDAEGDEGCRIHSNGMEHTRTARSGCTLVGASLYHTCRLPLERGARNSHLPP
eukprot:gene12759-biopygen3046